MFTKPTSPRSIGQVLDGSFRLTAAAFRRTWLYALLAILCVYASTAYQIWNMGSVATGLLQPLKYDFVYWMLYVVGIFASVLFTATIVRTTAAVADGDDAQVGIGDVLPRLPALVIGTILYAIAIMVGFILLIVPGIIVIVSLMFWMTLLILEGLGPVDALSASHRLVWGHWWRTFVILSVGAVICIVLYLILGMILGIAAPLLGSEGAIVGALLSMMVLMALAGIVIYPYFAALGLNIYWDLKLRKEGGDLAARAQAV